MSPRRNRVTLVLAVLCFFPASAQAATIEIVLEKIGYSPAEATAKVGDTIEWVNKDIVAHTATAKGAGWDVLIPPGKTGKLQLKQAGTVDYFCRFHPNMKARITVAP